MTDQHPLTDDIIRYDKKLGCHDLGAWVYTENDLRAAADWQLEQVIKFMKEHERMFGGSGMIFILEDAMRPTQEDN